MKSRCVPATQGRPLSRLVACLHTVLLCRFPQIQPEIRAKTFYSWAEHSLLEQLNFVALQAGVNFQAQTGAAHWEGIASLISNSQKFDLTVPVWAPLVLLQTTSFLCAALGALSP